MYYSNPKIEICQCEAVTIRIGKIISFDDETLAIPPPHMRSLWRATFPSGFAVPPEEGEIFQFVLQFVHEIQNGGRAFRGG